MDNDIFTNAVSNVQNLIAEVCEYVLREWQQPYSNFLTMSPVFVDVRSILEYSEFRIAYQVTLFTHKRVQQRPGSLLLGSVKCASVSPSATSQCRTPSTSTSATSTPSTASAPSACQLPSRRTARTPAPDNQRQLPQLLSVQSATRRSSARQLQRRQRLNTHQSTWHLVSSKMAPTPSLESKYSNDEILELLAHDNADHQYIIFRAVNNELFKLIHSSAHHDVAALATRTQQKFRRFVPPSYVQHIVNRRLFLNISYEHLVKLTEYGQAPVFCNIIKVDHVADSLSNIRNVLSFFLSTKNVFIRTYDKIQNQQFSYTHYFGCLSPIFHCRRHCPNFIYGPLYAPAAVDSNTKPAELQCANLKLFLPFFSSHTMPCNIFLYLLFLNFVSCTVYGPNNNLLSTVRT